MSTSEKLPVLHLLTQLIDEYQMETPSSRCFFRVMIFKEKITLSDGYIFLWQFVFYRFNKTVTKFE